MQAQPLAINLINGVFSCPKTPSACYCLYSMPTLALSGKSVLLVVTARMWSVLGTRCAEIDSQALRNQIRQRWRKSNVFLVASLFQVGFSSLEAQASGFIFSLLRMGENKESKQGLRGLRRALGLTFSSL